MAGRSRRKWSNLIGSLSGQNPAVRTGLFFLGIILNNLLPTTKSSRGQGSSLKKLSSFVKFEDDIVNRY
jgi:hypothetical protein